MTDHGAVISLGDSSFMVDGKAVHLDGMTHFCPTCKVQSKAVASNQGFMMVGGRSIVAVGDKSTCGSKYLKISDLAVMNKGSSSASSPSNSIAPLQNNFIENNAKKYGIQFQLKDETTQKVYSEIPYSITFKNTGKIETGWTDEEGKTHIINADSPDEVEFQTIDASKPLPPL